MNTVETPVTDPAPEDDPRLSGCLGHISQLAWAQLLEIASRQLPLLTRPPLDMTEISDEWRALIAKALVPLLSSE